MELSSVLPVVLAAVASVIAGLFVFRLKAVQLMDTLKAARSQLKHELQWENLNSRVKALEHGKAAESLGEETLNQFSDRLAKVEQTIEPLKGKPEFSSPEFSLLLYEIERIRQDMSSQQGSFEDSHSNKFATFRFTFSVFLVVITVLLSLAIYFLTIRGA